MAGAEEYYYRPRDEKLFDIGVITQEMQTFVGQIEKGSPRYTAVNDYLRIREVREDIDTLREKQSRFAAKAAREDLTELDQSILLGLYSELRIQEAIAGTFLARIDVMKDDEAYAQAYDTIGGLTSRLEAGYTMQHPHWPSAEATRQGTQDANSTLRELRDARFPHLAKRKHTPPPQP